MSNARVSRRVAAGAAGGFVQQGMMADALQAWLERIGSEPPDAPTPDALERLQRAHRGAICFENLDIMLGRGVDLDPDALLDKIVRRRRGGYCFEQNGLFLRMLLRLGFEARPLLARVWLAAESVPPRTHTLNLVRIGDEDWISDVGFGGSFVPPLRLERGGEAMTGDGSRHRLIGDPDHGWMLERDSGAGWTRQYSFTLEPVWPADLETANHFTATRPGTRFTTLRIASRPLADGYVSLIDNVLTRSRRNVAEVREIESADSYRRLLEEDFGLALSADEVERLGLFESLAAPSAAILI